jgi:hypothetical protein
VKYSAYKGIRNRSFAQKIKGTESFQYPLDNSVNSDTLLTRVSKPGKTENIESDITDQLLFIIKYYLLLQMLKTYIEKEGKSPKNNEIKQHAN